MTKFCVAIFLSFISMAAQANSFGVLQCKSQADRPGRQFEGQIQFSQQQGSLFVGTISGYFSISGSSSQALEATPISGQLKSFAAGDLFAVPSVNLRGVDQENMIAVNANASDVAALPSQISIRGAVYASLCQIVRP